MVRWGLVVSTASPHPGYMTTTVFTRSPAGRVVHLLAEVGSTTRCGADARFWAKWTQADTQGKTGADVRTAQICGACR